MAESPTCTQVQRQNHLCTAGIDDNGVTVATDFWVIRWSADTEAAACFNASAGGTLPRRGSPHPTLAALYAKRIDIKAIDGNTRQAFQAQIDYTDELNLTDSPLTQPPAISWDFADGGNAPYAKDFDPQGAKAVATSAGERFGDFLQRGSGTAIVTFRKNVLPTDTSPSLAVQYAAYQVDANSPAVPVMNSAAFTIDAVNVQQYQARFKGAQISEVQRSNGINYRTVAYTLALRKTWLDVVEDRGFFTKNAKGLLQPIPLSTDPAVALATANGWPLDGTGKKKPNVTDTPATRTFYPYPALSFAPFGFQ